MNTPWDGRRVTIYTGSHGPVSGTVVRTWLDSTGVPIVVELGGDTRFIPWRVITAICPHEEAS